MSCSADALVTARRVDELRGSMTALLGRSSDHLCVVYVEGPLRFPIDGELRHRVRALLRGGERSLVLDLAGVSRIDAAGVGELVRAYNMTLAADGVLRIVHANGWVREILDRVGLFEILTLGDRRVQ
jgi:anti-anti-sigma factor